MPRDFEAVSGWAWPMLSKKAHYSQRSARSLCMRWLYTGELTSGQNDGSPDDCRECARRKAKADSATRAPQPDTAEKERP